MASQNGRHALPVLVKDTLGEAQKRFAVLEKEAQLLAKDFVSRSRAAQKDLAKELERLQKRGAQWMDTRGIDRGFDRVRGRAKELSGEVRGRLEELQTSVLNLVGVASHEQVEAVSNELRRLAKKVDGMTRSARRGKPSGSATVS